MRIDSILITLNHSWDKARLWEVAVEVRTQPGVDCWLMLEQALEVLAIVLEVMAEITMVILEIMPGARETMIGTLDMTMEMVLETRNPVLEIEVCIRVANLQQVNSMDQ
uniref:Uncharacterized protein n=1 Tax=Cacopsylla melanoneura TaxID=428564 RepID=A0A8D8LJF3_9HEMI